MKTEALYGSRHFLIHISMKTFFTNSKLNFSPISLFELVYIFMENIKCAEENGLTTEK